MTGHAIQQLTWRELAYILVKHALHCEIRSCKDANACFGTCHVDFMLQGDVLITPQRDSTAECRVNLSATFPLSLRPSSCTHFISTFISQTVLPALRTCRLLTRSPSCSLICRHLRSPSPLSTDRSVFIRMRHVPSLLFLPCNPSASKTPTVIHSLQCRTLMVARFSMSIGRWETCKWLVYAPRCLVTDFSPSVPRGIEQLDVALAHYRELLFTSGLSSEQFAECISRDRGFLDDHEYVSLYFWSDTLLTLHV